DGVAAALLGVCLRCPVVVTLRGNEVALLRHPLRRRQLATALRHARVIAVSDALAAMAAALGTRRGRVHVIPNRIDPEWLRPGDRAAARRQLGLPPQRPILLSVGAFIARKGHERVVRGLPELIARHPDLLLVVVGASPARGSRLAALQRLAR